MCFMRRAGYLIVEREQHLEALDDGMHQRADFYADQVASVGTTAALASVQARTMISCDSEANSATTTGHLLSVLPNPSGTLLAEV
jgi:hypothetical protein